MFTANDHSTFVKDVLPTILRIDEKNLIKSKD